MCQVTVQNKLCGCKKNIKGNALTHWIS